MPSDDTKPAEAWLQLRQGDHEATGISIPTIASDVVTPAGPVRHALGSNGEARLLLPVGLREKLARFSESTALLVTDATYEQNGKPVRFIDLTCRVPELESVFSEVAEELISRIRNGHTCGDAVRSTLADFRALLLKPAAKEVSDAEIIGLVGELFILSRLLRINSDAWAAWRGPSGERHDFRRDVHALEVKTTSRTSDYSVKISAIDQLDPPAGGTLHLAHVILERATDAPLTVGSLVRDTTSDASQPGKVLQLVALLGCTDPDSTNWNRLSFNEEKVTFFSVCEDFPRITRASFRGFALPEGIKSIEYVIDLALVSNHILKTDEISDMEVRISG